MASIREVIELLVKIFSFLSTLLGDYFAEDKDTSAEA